MKYEIYKQLTPEQKEEYDFRFNKPLNINTNHILLLLIVFISVVTSNVIITFLIISNDMFISLRDVIMDVLRSTSYLITIGLYTVLISFVFNMSSIIYNGIVEYRWVKKTNIDTMPEWIRNLFPKKQIK